MGASSPASALATTSRRHAASASGGRLGSPTGCGIRPAGRMRIAPKAVAIDVIAVMSTVGRPAASICRASVAPQRVPVPQVLVRITACTPSLMSTVAISVPMRSALARLIPVPTVT